MDRDSSYHISDLLRYNKESESLPLKLKGSTVGLSTKLSSSSLPINNIKKRAHNNPGIRRNYADVPVCGL